MARPDGRALDALRPVEMIVGFHRPSEGSVLYRAGGTVVLCTASIDEKVPPFLEGKGKGWVTAEYQMHPRANPAARGARRARQGAERADAGDPAPRRARAPRGRRHSSGSGERTITIDCDVLEADGGTRTASVTGGFVALALALRRRWACARCASRSRRRASGCVERRGLALDLCYLEDSAAARRPQRRRHGDAGRSSRCRGRRRASRWRAREIDAMVDLALAGIARLAQLQRAALRARGSISRRSTRIARAGP